MKTGNVDNFFQFSLKQADSPRRTVGDLVTLPTNMFEIRKPEKQICFGKLKATAVIDVEN